MNSLVVNSNNITFNSLKSIKFKRLAKSEPYTSVNKIIDNLFADKYFNSFCRKNNVKLTIDTFREANIEEPLYCCTYSIEYKKIQKGFLGKIKALLTKPKFLTFSTKAKTLNNKIKAEDLALQNIKICKDTIKALLQDEKLT